VDSSLCLNFHACQMSACSEFAEHVWKPGSCKNCFHPLSAHKGLGALTALSPYSKPTIAVKPTMMSLESNDAMTDINMNIEQVTTFYLFFIPCFYVYTGLISNIFVTQEDDKSCQSFKKNDTGKQMNYIETSPTSKSTYTGNVVHSHNQEHDQASLGIHFPVSHLTKVHNGNESKANITATSSTSSIVLNVDTNGCTPLSSPLSPPSPTGSSSSYQSSNGSLSEGFGSKPVFSSPQTPTGNRSSQSESNSPTGPLAKEPIYAESTKKKQRTPDILKSPTNMKNSPCSVTLECPGECPRATITVMAAHTEENNRTFFLSSPDSAVSTQCHFSPSAHKDTSNPAFLWPSPSRSRSMAVDRLKSQHHMPGWSCRIDEEEEDEGKTAKGTTIQAERLVNGVANRKDARNCKSQISPPPITEPGIAPPLQSTMVPVRTSWMVPGQRRRASRTEAFLTSVYIGSRDATRMSCSSPFLCSPLPSAPGSPYPTMSDRSNKTPPPLPEKKMVNRTMSAPDSGKQFIRSYPNLHLTGSESLRCQPASSSQSSVPSSPVDQKSMFSSNECLERCHAPLGNTPLSGSEPASNVGSSLQLQTLLSNIDSREGVYSKLGGLYAESLRRLALKCEVHFTHSQRNPLRFEESNWSLFRLTSNKPSCSSGDAVYYSAACASDPSHSYAVKICKSPFVDAKQGHFYGLSVLQSMPTHFNLQQDCGHFMACVPQSMLPSEEASKPTSSLPAQPMDRERVVVITPDIPQQTASDFVREWATFHKEQPEVYERRVCFLLLQLCNGLEHLKEYGVTHRDLCLENLLLVAHPRRLLTCPDHSSNPLDIQRHLPRLLISSFAKAKRRSAEDGAFNSVDPRTKRDHARLAPEIVSAAQYRKFDEFQTGILIYELLHQPNPFEVSPALKEQDYRCENLPPIPSVSLYSDGLQKLAQLLLQPDPIKRIHIQEAKRILQSLLWGPRKDLMEQQWERNGQGANIMEASRHEGLLNWLDVKRALLMMKFAERSLEPERNAELEDWLCCQYFSSAHPLSLCHTAELLYSLK
uniref:Inactive tyrosine-protein kinase PEAK1 n=1 Tax=Neogobius melanostomus TaxID=47308 RepID=A0A8C6SXS2_9GOBI